MTSSRSSSQTRSRAHPPFPCCTPNQARRAAAGPPPHGATTERCRARTCQQPPERRAPFFHRLGAETRALAATGEASKLGLFSAVSGAEILIATQAPAPVERASSLVRGDSAQALLNTASLRVAFLL